VYFDTASDISEILISIYLKARQFLSEVYIILTLAARTHTDLQKKPQAAAIFRDGAILTFPNRAKLRHIKPN
jgi:hypothetical protein